MFGQAAALGGDDVLLIAVVTLLALGAVLGFYKEYTLTSFDAGFARSLGLPVQVFHYSLMLLLAFAIVSSLQAVGVVLVAAMLVIPAAAAFLLTDRFGIMLLLSALFGLCSGAIGSFFSFVGRNLPTGPFMVLAAAVVFALALFFGPRHGIVSRWWRHRSRSARIQRENTLKAIYHVLEDDEFKRESASVSELAERRRETLEEVQRQLSAVRKEGLVSTFDDSVSFTPSGWQRACEIVRNHRLWELYLTNAAHIAADHVHEDAEIIEHVLGEETVRKLEKRLNYARRDPHGKLIPVLQDIWGKRSEER
jgi:manganese/zinc/iron transport system permease protein